MNTNQPIDNLESITGTKLSDMLGKEEPKVDGDPFLNAEIDGNYNRELSNWEWLCRKYHMTKDGRLEKITKNNKKEKCFMRIIIMKTLQDKEFQVSLLLGLFMVVAIIMLIG